MATLTQIKNERITQIRKDGFAAIDAAEIEGLISMDAWEQAVEDVYNMPEQTDFFLQGCSHWSLPEKGRGLANYLKQYHKQEE